MATASVVVLAPNGRRQTVKCSPNTTVLQIIEEVCRKQGFKPEEYDIKHHNKVLDTTISFRFSGLPNNAQLELATATKTRVDSEITLALGLEDGSRLMGNFLPDETLWNVLTKLCPNEIKVEQNPVVIYMRNEVYGDKLHETTLRSLGLRGGRAMMRLVYKTPDELKTQANISAPLPAKPVEEKPYHRTLKTEPVPPSEQSQMLDDGNSGVRPVQKKMEIDFMKLAREKRKLGSPTKTPEKEVEHSKSKQKVDVIEDAQKIEEKYEEKMEVDVPEEINRVEPQKYEHEDNFVFLGERQAMLFSLESAHSVPAEDLPDDFFELTIDDAKKILGDIRRRRHEMDNSNLMTAAMRNLEESKKQLRQLHKYKQSVIRVQFPDRTILQGSFKPTETIKEVKDFVRNYLKHTDIDFHLYTTPPKNILSEQDSLVEIGCVPGALLHLGASSEDIENLHLKSEVRDKFTTNSLASLAASKLRKEGTRAESPQNYEMEDDDSTKSNDINAPGPSTQPTSYEKKVYKSTEKVPKWFKSSK